MVSGLWAAAIAAVIVAGMSYGTKSAPPMFIMAAVLTVTAAWLELRHRVDDDT